MHLIEYQAAARWLLTSLVCLIIWQAPARAQDGRWQRAMDAAITAHRQGDYGRAEEHLKAALEAAEGFAVQDRRLARTLLGLATVYFDQERYAEAGQLLERARALDERTLGPAHPALAITLNALALVYARTGKYERAEPLYRRALAIFEQAPESAGLEVARLLGNLAGLHLAQGRYEAAEPFYRRALAAFETAFGATHEEVARTLESYAVLLRITGRKAEAEKLEARAQALREDRGGTPAN